MTRGEPVRWNARLSKPLADGGATICEKHDFALANYEDSSMTWEVCQALTQAKDDGERMERRIQELGEEANNLEVCLDDAESEIVRLKIAHLRRMADLAGIRANDVLRDPFRLASKCVCRSLRFARVQNGCLAKIAELKESQ